MTHLKDQVAVVTGASGGIGKAIALSIAKHGARVCLVARRQAELEAVASLCQAFPRRLIPYPADLSQVESLNQLVARLRADFEYIDILIHSAGVYCRGPIAQASVADFDYQFRTNVLAPYALTQGLLSALRPRRGQIVFVNSSAGLAAPENLSQYAATKHALKAIADSLRQEVNRDEIRVLSVYLGRTATPMQTTIHAMENKLYEPETLMQADDIAAVIMNALVLPRSAEVTEIHMRQLKRPTV